MAKLDHFQSKNLNPADQLRASLDQLENSLPKLAKPNREQAQALLADLDRAEALLATLEAGGTGLASEQGRFATIQAKVKKRMGPVLKALGGPPGLVEQRPSPAPPRETRWWWHIDQEVAARQKQSLRRVVVTSVVLLVVLTVAYLLYQTLLAPSPEVLARYEAENRAMETLSSGDYELGLAEVEKGLAVVPNQAGLLIFKGVLEELAGNPEAAAQSFALAQANVIAPADFYIARAQAYLTAQKFDQVEDDARAAIKLDEKSAAGWLLLGQAFESQGQRGEAMQAYQRAGELAMERGDNELVVVARMSIGRLSGAIP